MLSRVLKMLKMKPEVTTGNLITILGGVIVFLSLIVKDQVANAERDLKISAIESAVIRTTKTADKLDNLSQKVNDLDKNLGEVNATQKVMLDLLKEVRNDRS